MESTQVLIEWEQKLSDAQKALQSFESQMGEMAISADSGVLATQLGELRNAVTIAEAAVKTAASKVGDLRIPQKRAQLEQAQAQVVEFNALAASWEATYQKLEPKYIEARDRMVSATQMAMRHENAVMNYQLELNELLREEAKSKG